MCNARTIKCPLNVPVSLARLQLPLSAVISDCNALTTGDPACWRQPSKVPLSGHSRVEHLLTALWHLRTKAGQGRSGLHRPRQSLLCPQHAAKAILYQSFYCL